jgi:hypothetical protein
MVVATKVGQAAMSPLWINELRALMDVQVDSSFHSERTDHFRQAVDSVMIEL